MTTYQQHPHMFRVCEHCDRPRDAHVWSEKAGALVCPITLRVGQRVMTKKFGMGTVLGFERFDAKGYEAPMGDVDYDGCCRVIFKPDDPNAWKATPGTPNPYLLRSDFTGDS